MPCASDSSKERRAFSFGGVVIAAQFPSHLNLSGDVNVIGPQPLKLLDVAPEYAVTQKIFKDKGATVGLATTSTVLVWRITYDGLTAAEYSTLLDHWNDAQGMFESFTFRHPYSGVLFSDVHYREFVNDHLKRHCRSCEIVLEKRPA